MIWIRKIVQIGGSIGMTFPSDLLKYLKLDNGGSFFIRDGKDEKGEYIILRKNLVKDD